MLLKFGTYDFDLFWVELGDCDIRDVCIEILGCELGSQSRFTSRGMIFCFSYLIFGWAFYFSDRSQRVRLFEVNVVPVNNLESLLLLNFSTSQSRSISRLYYQFFASFD